MPVTVSRTLACRSSAAAMWEAVADTDRLNRAAGMAKVRYEAIAAPSGARIRGHTRLGPIPVTYDELPFEWEEPRRMHIRREMVGGLLAWLELTYVLEPAGDGCTLTATLSMEPRLSLLGPVLRLRLPAAVGELLAEMAVADAAFAAGKPRPSPGPRVVVADALARAADRLRAERPSAANDPLVALVRDGGDADVARIRPYALADAWGLPRREVLSASLAAVPAGLFELRWEVVCPSCRVAADRIPTLADLRDHGRCNLCDIAFDLDFDRALEAVFAPAPAVRAVDVGPWCAAGPARTPHVLAQTLLPPGAEVALPAPAEAGRYRVFVRGGETTPVTVADEGTAEGEAKGEPLLVAPGGTVRVASRHDDPRHAKLERADPTGDAATARDVTALPAFRAHFSSDTLKPGITLRVSRVAVFFSDLTDSTRLYARAGDAAAFRLVQDHFDVLRAPLESHGGVIVKTIGDAVMAVFADEDEALRASLAALAAFRDFRRTGGLRGEVDLKLGVYAGSAYVCTANGVIDYFGQSVNIAARLQGTARAGELVVPAELADRVEGAVVVERFTPSLKGVETPIPAVRLTVG
ncbi:MAG: DUF5939 domain-containing protein [Myxococcota bacterium]